MTTDYRWLLLAHLRTQADRLLLDAEIIEELIQNQRNWTDAYRRQHERRLKTLQERHRRWHAWERFVQAAIDAGIQVPRRGAKRVAKK